MESNFVFQNIDVTNELKIADNDFAIFTTVDLGAKSMMIENSNYEIEGTVMITVTTLSFYATNVEMATFTLAGGFIFSIACGPDDVVVGEVVLDNVRLVGQRDTLFKYGGIFMTGPQNFTIQNSFIGSYAFMYDAKQLTRADSPSACLPDDDAY